VPVTAWSKASFCYSSFAGNAGSIPADDMDVCLFVVLSGRGLCFGLFTSPENSYLVLGI